MYKTRMHVRRLAAVLLNQPFYLNANNQRVAAPASLRAIVCDWYICRVDYGRPNVWPPMYWVYVRANRHVNG